MGDIANVVNVVNTVGFPIACFFVTVWFIKYLYDKQLEKDKLADERDDRHWEEISQLTQAVNNNTEVLRDLVKRQMEGERND